MPILMFFDPTDQSKQYWTSSLSDPGIPAGYLYSQGSDGGTPEALQVYVGNLNNQGAGSPAVTNGDPTQIAAQPNWPNGLISANPGNSKTAT